MDGWMDGWMYIQLKRWHSFDKKQQSLCMYVWFGLGLGLG